MEKNAISEINRKKIDYEICRYKSFTYNFIEEIMAFFKFSIDYLN